MTNWIYFGCSNGLGVLFCVLFVLIGVLKSKNKSYSEQLKPIKFLFILVVVLEIIKITYHICVQSYFPPQRYPIVFCSLIMYTYPIICFNDKDKMITRVSMALSIIPVVVISGMYLFIFPDATNASIYSFIMNLHSRFYHFAMLAGALYMLILKMYDFRFKDYFMAASIASLYIVFCTVVSLLLKGDISYFGPDSGPLKFFYNLFGYAIGNVLICIVIYIVAFLVYYIINYFILKQNKSEMNFTLRE